MNTEQKDLPRVRLEDDMFWINGTYAYPIEEDRITSERDLLAWVRHLSRKAWADRKLIGEFVDVVANAKGFKLRISK